MTTQTHQSSSLVVAKRRARRRARQGGAVVFIVSMTIGVLVSLGAFALISASTEIKSAGYERQALQTHYLAEYGMVAASAKLGPDYAIAIEAMMRTPGLLSTKSVGDYDDTFPRNHCASLEAVPVTASASSRACKILRMSDLSQGWVGLTAPLRTAAQAFPSFAGPGATGAVQLEGNFSVEITDTQFYEPLAGNANIGQSQTTLSLCPVSFSVTTYGQVMPPQSLANNLQIYGSSSLETGRGRVTGGPIPCPQ